MTSGSLFEDCQACLLKGHESWKSFFSKWESLGKHEENLPEDELESLLDYPEDDAPETVKKSQPLKSLKAKKPIKKNSKVKRIKKKVLLKEKALEQPTIEGNENLSVESTNKQLELDLKTIFMDILKVNKNKWEIFGVLSQTFSHVEVTKASYHLSPNHHLALSSNDVKVDRIRLSIGDSTFCQTNTKLVLSPGIRFHSFENQFDVFSSPRLFRGIRSSIPSDNDKLKSASVPVNNFQTPFQPRKINFSFQERFLKSCPNKSVSSSHLHSGEHNKMLKPLALDFGNIYTRGEYSKINNENFVRTRCEEPKLQHAPETNIYQEKSFHNLCLHKRTNDVSLNMENSNFITPKRKPSERKCFSENILHRKRRRPSKLAFFDSEESESDDDDDRKVGKSPKIICENKKMKIDEKESSDSECESILERVKRP